MIVADKALSTYVRTQPRERPDLGKILFPYDSRKYLIGPGNVQVNVSWFAFTGRGLADAGHDTADRDVLTLMLPGLSGGQSLGIAGGNAEKEEAC